MPLLPTSQIESVNEYELLIHIQVYSTRAHLVRYRTHGVPPLPTSRIESVNEYELLIHIQVYSTRAHLVRYGRHGVPPLPTSRMETTAQNHARVYTHEHTHIHRAKAKISFCIYHATGTQQRIPVCQLVLQMSLDVSKPTRFVSKPTRFVSKPTRFVSKPTRFVSKPTRFGPFPNHIGQLQKRLAAKKSQFVFNHGSALKRPLREGAGMHHHVFVSVGVF